ncbi:unnamed protein product [Ixodes persulcatus]
MQGPYSNQGWVPYGYPVDHTYAWYEKRTFQGSGVSSFYYYPLQEQQPCDSGIAGCRNATKMPIPCKSTKVGSSHEWSGSHSSLSYKVQESGFQATETYRTEVKEFHGMTPSSGSSWKDSKVAVSHHAMPMEISPVSTWKDPEVEECHDVVPMDISPVSSPKREISNDETSSRHCSSHVKGLASDSASSAKHILEKVSFRTVDAQNMSSSGLNVLKKSTKCFVPIAMKVEAINSECTAKQASEPPSHGTNGSCFRGERLRSGGLVWSVKGAGFKDYSRVRHPRLPPDWLTPQPVKRQDGNPLDRKCTINQKAPKPKALGASGSTSKLVNERVTGPLGNVISETSSVNPTRASVTGLQSELVHKQGREKAAVRLPPDWCTPQPVKVSGRSLNWKFASNEKAFKLRIGPMSTTTGGKKSEKLVNQEVISSRSNVISEKSFGNPIRASSTGLQTEIVHKQKIDKAAIVMPSDRCTPEPMKVHGKVLNGKIASNDKAANPRIVSESKATDGVKTEVLRKKEVIGSLSNVMSEASSLSTVGASSRVQPELVNKKATRKVAYGTLKQPCILLSIENNTTRTNLVAEKNTKMAPQKDISNAIDSIVGGVETKPMKEEQTSESTSVCSIGNSESATVYVVPDDISNSLSSWGDIAFSSSSGGCVLEKLELTLQLEKLHDGFIWGD